MGSTPSSADGLDVGSASGAGGAAGGLLDTAWSDDWRVLLYDAHTKAILSPLLSVAELRACGVTLHLPLESPRDAIPDVSALYFLSPSPASMRLLAEDAAAGRYRDASVFVTPSLPRPALESLAAACVTAGAVPRITRLMDAYASFVALQPRLFASVGMPRSLSAFASPSAGEEQVGAFVEAATASLVSLCATAGVCPVIVAPRGGPAELIARRLESALRDHLASPTAPLFSANAAAAAAAAGPGAMGAWERAAGAGGGSGSSSGQDALVRSLLGHRSPVSLGAGPAARPVLLLLDRTVDLAAPLAHASSYEALVDDCLGPIEGNRVTLPAATSAAAAASGAGAGAGGPSGAVTLAELDEFHPSRSSAGGAGSAGAAGGARGATGSSAGAGGVGGAGSWLLDWAAGKGGSSSSGDAAGAAGAAPGAAAAAGGKVVTLDPDADPFWGSLCRAPLPAAIESHERELNALVAREREIRRAAGASAETAGAAAVDALLAGEDGPGAGAGMGAMGPGGMLAGLSASIESLPALLRRKKLLESHAALLAAVFARVAARMLPPLHELEAVLLSQPHGSPAVLAGLDRPALYAALGDTSKGTHADRLRLAAIYLLTVPVQALTGSGGGVGAPGAGGPGGGSSGSGGGLAEEAAAVQRAVTAGATPAFAAYASAVLGFVKSLRTGPSLLAASAPHLVSMISGGGAFGGGGGGSDGSGGGGAAGLFSSLFSRAAAQVQAQVSRLAGGGESRFPVTAIAAAVCDGKPTAAAPFAVGSFLVADPRAPAAAGDRTFAQYIAAASAAASAAAGGGGGGGAMGSSGGIGGGPGGSAGGAMGSAAAAAAAAALSPASFRNAFVYMVGGACYAEAADLQAWADGPATGSSGAGGSGSGGAGGAGGSGGGSSGGMGMGMGGAGSGRTVVYGGTDIVSPSAFLAQLHELGVASGFGAAAAPAASGVASVGGPAAAAFGGGHR